jgi:hypothetical protein
MFSLTDIFDSNFRRLFSLFTYLHIGHTQRENRKIRKI